VVSWNTGAQAPALLARQELLARHSKINKFCVPGPCGVLILKTTVMRQVRIFVGRAYWRGDEITDGMLIRLGLNTITGLVARSQY